MTGGSGTDLGGSPATQASVSDAPRRRKAEIVFIGLFAALQLAVPVAREEFFPFTRAPLFIDSPKTYSIYTVIGPDRRVIDAHALGLGLEYWGLNGFHK